MISISLCMIVRDEEQTLGRCLDSVKAAADEIVIVDTGSKDATKEVAAKYTDRIYDFRWCDDFSAARNFAFDRGTKDYLMWLDADDVLPESSLKKLLALKETLDPGVSVVMMPYHVAFDQAGRPSFMYERERLIKNRAGFRWRGAVHEAIAPRGKVLHSDVAVEHRKLKPGEAWRNLRIYEKQLAEGRPMSPRERFYYARELFYNRRYEQALAEFGRFLDTPGTWLENRLDAYRMSAACHELLGRPDRAMELLLKSLGEDAPRAEICCDIGRLFMDREKYKAAAFWYETAASRRPCAESGAFLNRDCYGYIPYMQLCVCSYRLGELEQARKYHMLAAELKPEDPAVKHNGAFFVSPEQGGGKG